MRGQARTARGAEQGELRASIHAVLIFLVLFYQEKERKKTMRANASVHLCITQLPRQSSKK
jgi:hypothetical protein